MYKYILSFFSLLVITGCGGDSESPTNSNVELEYSDHVSVTGKQTCSVIGKELQCSGSNWMGGSLIQLPTPPVSESVELVSVGHNHACEIAGNEVKCWGDNSNGELNVPFLSKSYLIACGESFSCAADSAGLDCWGYQGGSFCIDSSCSSWIVISDPTSNPELRNITDLSVSNLYGCAITNGQVKCWGHASYGQTRVLSS